jgi:hypothetical protein
MTTCQGEPMSDLAVGAPVHRLAGPFVAALSGPPELIARVGAGLPPATSPAPAEAHSVIPVALAYGAPARAAAPIVRHQHATISRNPRGELVVAAAGASALLGEGGIAVRIAAAADPVLVRLVLDMTWPLVLARVGFYHVHAAAVRDGRGRGWLLAGEANVGKSTSALSLAGAGWEYAADDAVYLASCDGDLAAHGWAEPVRLSARSAKALGVGREQEAFDLKAPAVLSSALAARRVAAVRVDRVLFPTLGPTTTHRWLGASAALTRLVRAAPCITVQAAPARDYLATLARAASLPAAELVLGRELLCEPGRLAEYLGEIDDYPEGRVDIQVGGPVATSIT